MRWNQIDPYHLKRGLWTLTKGQPVDVLPKPYGLWFNGKLVGHFKTSQEAMQEAEYQEATQI